jgi:glycosyltransferase involved in cell wall biosynthesis
MRIEVVTSLYPSAVHPLEGIFAERRWLGMRARGHEVRVLQPLPLASRLLPLARWRALARVPRRESRGGIEVERPRYLHWPGRARANAAAFARVALRALARRPRPDVVVLDYAWPAAAAAAALRAQRLPCVVSGRGSDVLAVAEDPALTHELAHALRAAGHWCAVSRDLLRLMDHLGSAAGQGRLVPNGVDTALFHPRVRNECRRALGLPAADAHGRPRVVLVCGHLIERKDPLLALETFSRARAEEDRLVFVGRGPLAGRVRARATELGLATQVELRGEVAPGELALCYGACDLLLLTSRREGRPNVVLEALAAGRPVLATEAGGTGEVLGALAPRLLARTRDPGALAQRLRELLESPPAEQELTAAIGGLTWKASLTALEACLAEAIAEGRPA